MKRALPILAPLALVTGALFLWLARDEPVRGLMPGADSSVSTAPIRVPSSAPQGSSATTVPEGFCAVHVYLDLVDSVRNPDRGLVVALPQGRNQSVAAAQADRRGVAYLLLKPGTYAFRVEPESLPEGMLLPPLQDELTYDPVDGLHAPVATLKRGAGRTQVPVPIRLRARISGRVTRTDGGPAALAPVRVFSDRADGPFLSWMTSTDEDGRYALDVHPGDLWVQAASLVRERPPELEFFPRPTFHSVSDGEDVELDFTLGAGSSAVFGKLLASRGMGEERLPVPGLRVLAQAWDEERARESEGRGYAWTVSVAQSTTNRNGNFLMDGLPPGCYRLVFGPWGSGSDPIDPYAPYASPIEPRVIHLAPNEGLDIGEVVGRAAAPLGLAGQIVGAGATDRRLELEVLHPAQWPGAERYARTLEVRADGSFETWMMGGSAGLPATLRLRLWGETEWALVQDVELGPWRQDNRVRLLLPGQ